MSIIESKVPDGTNQAKNAAEPRLIGQGTPDNAAADLQLKDITTPG
jgi:hypothetical protein